MVKEYAVSELGEILREMADYADNSIAWDDASQYDYFQEIVGTGLFHDAIGKVTHLEHDVVAISDDY